MSQCPKILPTSSLAWGGAGESFTHPDICVRICVFFLKRQGGNGQSEGPGGAEKQHTAQREGNSLSATILALPGNESFWACFCVGIVGILLHLWCSFKSSPQNGYQKWHAGSKNHIYLYLPPDRETQKIAIFLGLMCVEFVS